MTAEQKAEEIANKRCHEIMCYGHCNFSSPKHHRCGEWHREYNCALDGYHEGFKDCAKSRLNVTTISDCPIKDDWHYVKDEGTPIHEGHYLVCLRNKNHDILDCWILFDKDVGWYSLQVRLVDIYAWKEIVLPKESE